MLKKRKNDKPKKSQGIFFNTDIGQHVLKNPLIINNIVEKSNIHSNDIVLEVGPGTGNLTAKLLEKAKQVIVIELDSRMVAELEKRFRSSHLYSKLKIIVGDALKVDLPYFNICVANLPYQISSPFIFRLLAHRPLYRSCILMVQREFANRLIAKPGDKCYCRLSTNSQILAKIDNLLKVGRNNFKPPPKIDSNVVRIVPRNPPFNVDYAEWDGMTRVCFVRKNKTISAAFKSKSVLEQLKCNYNKKHSNENNTMDFEIDISQIIKNIISSNGFEEKRSRTMSIHEFMMLLKCFNEAGIYFSNLAQCMDIEDDDEDN